MSANTSTATPLTMMYSTNNAIIANSQIAIEESSNNIQCFTIKDNKIVEVDCFKQSSIKQSLDVEIFCDFIFIIFMIIYITDKLFDN